MTIISSMKPLSDSPTIARNQIRAWESWRLIADHICYFNEPQPGISDGKTSYAPSPAFPRIKTLAIAAALAPGPACIVNADIVLGQHTPHILRFVAQRGGKAGVSRRYQFEGDNPESGELINGDWGLDFFFASRQIWWGLSKVISPQYRIGHTGWDSYVLSYFNTKAGAYTWDITARRCVFHPKHEERHRPYYIQPECTEMMLRSGMPFNRL